MDFIIIRYKQEMQITLENTKYENMHRKQM